MMEQGKSSQHPKLLFFVTEDWYFCSHRLPLAVAASNAGYEVVVVTREDKHGDKIRAANLKLIPINFRRRGANPFREIIFIRHLISLYQQEQPDIVHHIALKPVLYGALAARLVRVPCVVNALAGLGYLFSSRQWKAKFLRPFVEKAFRILLNRRNSRTILQNPDDAVSLVHRGVVRKERVALIRGSGVDLKTFFPVPEPEQVPIVLLASRMLWDKGVGEFVKAAAVINENGIKARFVLVGVSDPENPASVPNTQLQKWHADGVIEWWGHQENMPPIFAVSNICCLPTSYGEGVPKVLIEAASCGRAIVTTDAPGCREIVKNGENGFLVPIGNPVALVDALRRLIVEPNLRVQMGMRGREIAEADFSIEKVTSQTLDVYKDLLSCNSNKF
ncbi:MAG: glycosyltransferase family 4 protein [Thermodesulfobacteriota bacterium]